MKKEINNLIHTRSCSSLSWPDPISPLNLSAKAAKVRPQLAILPSISWIWHLLWLGIALFLVGCASRKPRYVVIQIENQPTGVPFQRVGYDVSADIGHQFRVIPYSSYSHMTEYVQYLVDFTGMKKYKDIVTEFVVVEADTARTIKDNVVFKDSCEFVYNVKKGKELPSKASVIVYSNDSLSIFKTEDNYCSQ